MAGHLSGTSVPFSGHTWFQKWFSKKRLTKWEEQLSTFLRTENLNLFSVFSTLRKLLSCSADSAKDGTRKNWQFCTRKLSGIFVPLSGRICARDFCPTIWTYKNLVPGKFSEILCPTILPKMAPEKIDNFVPENFQGFLSHYLGVFVPGTSVPLFDTIWTYIANRKIFRDFCPTILPKMAPEKIDNFVPENFQGFLFHYLGVFVPGTSVPLSGRIRIWFQENFQRFCVPLYCQRWRPKKLTILYQKIFRDFCPTIWAYLCQGLLSHYLDV